MDVVPVAGRRRWALEPLQSVALSPAMIEFWTSSANQDRLICSWGWMCLSTFSTVRSTETLIPWRVCTTRI